MKMNIVKTSQVYYASITYIVLLSKEQETIDDTTLIKELAKLHGYCFGGRVERRKGKKSNNMYAKVVVYLD